MLKQFAAAIVLSLILALPTLAHPQTKQKKYDASGPLLVTVAAEDYWDYQTAPGSKRRYCYWAITLDWVEDFAVAKYQFRFNAPGRGEPKWSPHVPQSIYEFEHKFPSGAWLNTNMGGKWLDHPWGDRWRNVSQKWLDKGTASKVTIIFLADNQAIRVRARALDETGKVLYNSRVINLQLGAVPSDGCYIS